MISANPLRVSIVIPCFNAVKYLAAAVESLNRSGYPDLEILIVDDASTDGSDRVAADLQSRYSTVKVLTHPGRVNRGEGGSRNLGIRHATGEIVGFLDADDFVYPHRFDVAMRRFRESADIDGIYDLARLVFEPDTKESFWPDEIVGIRKELEQDQLLTELLSGRTWIPSTFMCRASLLRKIGLFEEIRGVAIDVNFFLRAACAGRIVAGNLADPVVAYRRHGNNMFSTSAESYRANVWSMARAARWAARNDIRPDLLSLYREKFGDYLNTACYEVRRMGRPDVALDMIQLSAKCGQWRPVCQYRILRQAGSAVRSLLRHPQGTQKGADKLCAK